ncbi:hypothetical protein QYF36_002398 [Acer negundo]|nr:hypothetical protein QYF36_002398 [Acer negundo]
MVALSGRGTMDFYGKHTYDDKREANHNRANEEFPSHPEHEKDTTIHCSDKIVDYRCIHDFVDNVSNVPEEEMENEVMNEEVKEVEDVSIEEPLIYNELKPFVPRSTNSLYGSPKQKPSFLGCLNHF